MSREFKIGLLTFVSLTFLYLGFNFLKGQDFFSSDKTYKVIYKDLNGLTTASTIRLNGFQVGRILNIEILPDQAHNLMVTIDIRSDLDITQGTQAILKDDGLLGGKMIDLKIADNKTVLASGDTLIAASEASLLAGLTERAEPLVESTDAILKDLRVILDTLATSRGNVVATLEDFKEISSTLNSSLAQANLAQTLRNFNKLSYDLAALSKDLPPILENANAAMDNFAQLDLKPTLDSANQALAILSDVLRKIEQGEGTLGALATNDSLYNNLNGVSESVDKLFIDLRENPKRYVQFSVFGKKEKKENGNQ